MAKRHRNKIQTRPLEQTQIVPPSALRERVLTTAQAKIDMEAGHLPRPAQFHLGEQERALLKEMRKGKKTFVLFGWAEKTRGMCPWDDYESGTEFWSLNESYADPSGFITMLKITGWFQLHRRWDYARQNNHNDANHFDWLKQAHDYPIYMIQHWDDIPSSVEYPLDEICYAYGANAPRARRFKSTAAFMLAMAIHKGAEHIELYGIEMVMGDDYIQQRANFEFWMGVAVAKGIYIYTPPPSALTWWNEPLYGYDAKPRLTPTHLELKRHSYVQQVQQLERHAFELQGAMDQLAEERKKTSNVVKRKEMNQKLEELQAQLVNTLQKAAFAQGNKTAFTWIINEVKERGEVQLVLDATEAKND